MRLLLIMCVIATIFSIFINCKKKDKLSETQSSANHPPLRAGESAKEELTKAAETNSQEQLKKITAQTRLIFPASTRLLGYRIQSGLDETVYVKIKIRRDDLPAFLQQSQLVKTQFRSDWWLRPNINMDYWKAKECPKLFQVGQVELPDACALNIYIDLDEEKYVTVYIALITT